MGYSIKQLAELAGVTTRTLRWYERQGLLEPRRETNGYRSYSSDEVARLHQILLYRELGFELKEIAELLDENGEDLLSRLKWQLSALKERREHIDALISNVKRTISAQEKGGSMSDSERFEVFKQKALEENERKYGEEIRAKYGEKAVSDSNAKFAAMTDEQHGQMEQLNAELAETLKAAIAEGDPKGETARKLAEMHKRWLLYYWPSYTVEQHRGVTQMYVEDERFKKYYDEIVAGGAQFLRDAVWAWAE
ncbi:MAG TPA: MerR family transcriptional regulator [Coriobacteriia bacterium]|nr:MerR family transcriptional regulator [Coriobacteriia bacterium]